MEDVLEVYQRQFGDNEVLVCLDETSKQQVKETRLPRPLRPGSAVAYDYEYERNGVSNLFMLFAPLEGWRRVGVTDRRTKVDWAHQVKKLVDEDYPDKDRIVLVMDNLNTHHPASLYEAFEPMEARRIAERLEIHYTPKHGSWLDMAEIEIGVLARQCLDRRIPDQEVLRREVDAWQNQRNRDMVRVDWRFTTDDARIKLKSLYPAAPRATKLTRCTGPSRRSAQHFTAHGAKPGVVLLTLTVPPMTPCSRMYCAFVKHILTRATVYQPPFTQQFKIAELLGCPAPEDSNEKNYWQNLRCTWNPVEASTGVHIALSSITMTTWGAERIVLSRKVKRPLISALVEFFPASKTAKKTAPFDNPSL